MKPKCPNVIDPVKKQACGKSVKRPYERKGASGTLTSLKDWWFCPVCNFMLKQPYHPRRNKEDYIDPQGADKFPVIARLQEERAPTYVRVVEELEEKTIKIKEHMFSPVPNTMIGLAEEFTPVWHCKYCGYELECEKSIVLREDTEAPEQPVHCREPMRILLRKGMYFNENVRFPMDIIQDSLKDGEKEKAGIAFLDMVIDHLSGKKRPLRITQENEREASSTIFSQTRFSMDLQRGLLTDLVKLSRTDIYYKKLLHSSWGYKAAIQLIQTFVDLPELISVNGLSRINLKVAFANNITYETLNLLYQRGLRENATTISRLISVFDDIINFMSSKYPDKIPDYRMKQYAILRHQARTSILGIDLYSS